MKKVILTAALGLATLVMQAQYTAVPQPTLVQGTAWPTQNNYGPGIIGSSLTVPGMPHNFAGTSWNPQIKASVYGSTTSKVVGGDQICQPCHTPHNGHLGEEALWNHNMSSATYTLYESVHGTNTLMSTQPDGVSAMCLSCHDGTVGLGAFGGTAASTTGLLTLAGTGADFGTDLSNDHPISVPYDALSSTTGAAGAGTTGITRLNLLTSGIKTYTPNADGSYNSAGWTTSTTSFVSGMLDANGKIQCSSCHRPHANSNGYQLIYNNEGSALCLTCHSK